MRIGEKVRVKCLKAPAGSFRGVLQDFVQNRSNGNGVVSGTTGFGNEDYLLVQINGLTGVYFYREVSALMSAKEMYPEISASKLDDLVHQECASMASSINNEGRQSQVEFLKERGFTDSDFEQASDKKRK